MPHYPLTKKTYFLHFFGKVGPEKGVRTAFCRARNAFLAASPPKYGKVSRMTLQERALRERANNQPTTTATDWSGWENWMEAHLEKERALWRSVLGALLANEREKFHDQLERKTNQFEVKLAKLSGAIDVLRGVQPPPPAKFPHVKAWSADTIYHEGDIVAFAGGTYQATKDTARAPGVQDWVCVASPGSSLTMRGTYDNTIEYRRLDVVMFNGSSFVALTDNPGRCPGKGATLPHSSSL